MEAMDIFHNSTKFGYTYRVASTTKTTLFGSINDVENNIISRKPRQGTHHQHFYKSINKTLMNNAYLLKIIFD